MPQQDDKIRREVEELLDKLDNFVPEERLISKMRSREKAAAGPNALERIWQRLTRISLGHAMLAGIILLVIGMLFRNSLGGAATTLVVAGIVLVVGAFVLSLIGADSRRTLAGGRPEKRWRGQVIDYSEPSPTSKIREWFRNRRRR